MQSNGSDQNSKLFLECFSELESTLKVLLRKEAFAPFKSLLNEAAKTFPTIRNNVSLLTGMADLRNVVVHSIERVRAVPTDETVRALQDVVTGIKRDLQSLEQFRNVVHEFRLSDNIFDVLRYMHEQ